MVQHIMKSRYKHLVVSGCSFTTNEHVPDKSDWNWPNILAADTGMKIHNLASAAVSNTHIANSIILYLTTHPELTPDNTLVMAMWTGVGRIDVLATSEYVHNDAADNCRYNSHVRCVPGGHWWNNRNSNLGTETIRNISRLQSDHSFTLASWLEMQKLEDFLQARNFVYRFTSFVNYGDNLIKGDALVVPFEQCLSDLNLAINRINWLPLANKDHYGDWCRERNLLSPDGFHPGLDGPQRWPREVVIPVLTQQDILQ